MIKIIKTIFRKTSNQKETKRNNVTTLHHLLEEISQYVIPELELSLKTIRKSQNLSEIQVKSLIGECLNIKTIILEQVVKPYEIIQNNFPENLASFNNLKLRLNQITKENEELKDLEIKLENLLKEIRVFLDKLQTSSNNI